MNHSYISLAERTGVLLKHVNAREHRDWHMSLVSRALLTNTVYPCVEASPPRLPQPSRFSIAQSRGACPRRMLGAGAAGRGRQGVCAAEGPLGKPLPSYWAALGAEERSIFPVCGAGRGTGEGGGLASPPGERCCRGTPQRWHWNQGAQLMSTPP